jgi:hypothetical protein
MKARPGFVPRNRVGEEYSYDVVLSHDDKTATVKCSRCGEQSDVTLLSLDIRKCRPAGRRCKGCTRKRVEAIIAQGPRSLTGAEVRMILKRAKESVYDTLRGWSHLFIEDVVSETILAILMREFRPEDDLKGLATSIARRIAIQMAFEDNPKHHYEFVDAVIPDEDVFESLLIPQRHDTGKIEKQAALFDSLSEDDKSFLRSYHCLGVLQRSPLHIRRWEALCTKLRGQLREWEENRI